MSPYSSSSTLSLLILLEPGFSFFRRTPPRGPCHSDFYSFSLICHGQVKFARRPHNEASILGTLWLIDPDFLSLVLVPEEDSESTRNKYPLS